MLAIFALQCSAQKTSTKKSPSSVKSVQSNIQKFELEEITRGQRRMATITAASKIIEINGKTTTTKTTSTEWNNLLKLASKLELKKLDTHASPTTKRYYDGAMAAVLRITANSDSYESQGFDSGIPPKAFSELYFALAESFRSK